MNDEEKLLTTHSTRVGTVVLLSTLDSRKASPGTLKADQKGH